jgi:hypothetical protein
MLWMLTTMNDKHFSISLSGFFLLLVALLFFSIVANILFKNIIFII